LYSITDVYCERKSSLKEHGTKTQKN
jgi:hypothetical protein